MMRSKLAWEIDENSRFWKLRNVPCQVTYRLFTSPMEIGDDNMRGLGH